MDSKNRISEDLSRRIDRLAARSTLTRERIIEDALSHGRSLAWQEKWIAGVEEGIDDADNGAFANPDEIAAVLNKYGQP
ncbi:CopG family ribbon-helix-helix protein [Pararhizobium sp. O133]|uniref:CopG family ribbon-helix-helix protein n=1 Tax=Pararhizobium sp. O133 TaxID=3449278 RepID=UPI003F685315